MINPFAGFLQPVRQQSPLAGAGEFVNQISQLGLQRKQLDQSAAQHADSSARDWKRIGLQEQVQNRNFSEMDKAEIENLLAEYDQARGSGVPERMESIKWKLKRFGLDVDQGGSTGPATDSRAFTGTLPGQFLPSTTRQPEAPLQSQEEFERELIEGSPLPPERYESTEGGKTGGGTTPEFKARLDAMNKGIPDSAPQLPGQNLPRVSPRRGPGEDNVLQSPEAMRQVNARAADEAANPRFYRDPSKGQSDITDPGTETQSAAPQAASAQVPPLPGMNLPTRISKAGKTLYESTGPSGRWAPMVQSVFQAAAQHQDPEFAAAGKRAQEMATKLIGVDGIAPKDAIKFAADQLQNEIQNITNFRRTELGTRPKYAGGGGGGGLLGKTQDIAESIRMYSIPAANRAQRILNESDQYADMEAGLSSGDPALQRNAINVLYKIRAGTAVSAAEDARVGGIVSMLDKFENKFRQWSGGPISPEMLSAMQQIVRTKQRINRDRVQSIFDQAADEWEAQNEGKIKDPEVFKRRAKTIRAGARAGGTSADDRAAELLEE